MGKKEGKKRELAEKGGEEGINGGDLGRGRKEEKGVGGEMEKKGKRGSFGEK